MLLCCVFLSLYLWSYSPDTIIFIEHMSAINIHDYQESTAKLMINELAMHRHVTSHPLRIL